MDEGSHRNYGSYISSMEQDYGILTHCKISRVDTICKSRGIHDFYS